MTRNPRIEPRQGDRLVKDRHCPANRVERIVVNVDRGIVEYQTPKGRRLSQFISQWRKWAEKAEVGR